MTSFTTYPDVDRLARFTAAVLGSVPEFDPAETPIGHALAAEFFATPLTWTAPEREPVTTMLPIVRPAVVVELPVPTESNGPAEAWFGDAEHGDTRLAS